MRMMFGGCHDSFDFPDGKGIMRAGCPCCERANDFRMPTAFEPRASIHPLF